MFLRADKITENNFMENLVFCVPPFRKTSNPGGKNTKKSQKLRDRDMAIKKKHKKT